MKVKLQIHFIGKRSYKLGLALIKVLLYKCTHNSKYPYSNPKFVSQPISFSSLAPGLTT